MGLFFHMQNPRKNACPTVETYFLSKLQSIKLGNLNRRVCGLKGEVQASPQLSFAQNQHFLPSSHSKCLFEPASWLAIR